MSKENVRLFYSTLAEDKALQEKFNEINARLADEYKGERPDEKRVNEILRHDFLPVAREAGFEFSLDELKAYSAEGKATGELADEELAGAVGGENRCMLCFQVPPPPPPL